MRYDDASGAFQASGPVANDDSDTLAAGSRGPATGNLITGEGEQYGSAGADSAVGGHITSIAGKGGEDSSFAGGKLSVAGEFGQLSVDANGNYTYMANKGAPENVRDRFTYTLADAQGNSDTAALIVEIGKTPVVIKAGAQQIVPGPDGVVTLPPGVELSDIMVVGRNLVINMPDGTQLVIVDGAIFVPQLVLDGVQVPATNVAALLIGQEPQPAAGETPPSSGGNFEVPPPPLDPGVPLGDLIPPTEYNYKPPEPQETFPIENKLPVDFGNIDILIDDDTLPGGLAGGPGDGPDGVNIHGFLSALALSQIGGNGPLTFSLELTSAPAGFELVSGGPGIALLLQNGVTVRTITFDPATGEYDVTQNARILHPAGGEENNDVFVLTVTATDQDGDTAHGTITITYNDDTPEATQLQVGGTVDEDGVPGGIAGGPDDVAGEDTVVNGSVVGLFLPGADGPLTYGLSGNTSGLPALTSHGVAVTYAIAGDTLTASAGGSPVFTLVVHSDGSYTFTLLDQLDHATLNGQPGDNSENELSLALGSVIQATDQDGDPVTAPANALVIVVDDDTPVALEGSSSGTVDEDGVPGGIAGGVGDVAGAATVANGSIASLFASGADAPLSFGLLSDTSGLPALTSGGAAVTYAVAGNTLTASAAGHTVFTLVLNSDGSWTFTLADQLDHSAGLDENDLTIDFSSILQATDADGDSVGAGPRALLITVDDDTPTTSENQVTGTVDEDGVVEGVADGGEGDGIAGGVGDVAGQNTVASGSVAAMFNSGADQPLSYGFAANAVAALEALGLTSNGVALDYALVGNTITASTAAGDVFTFELNANGSWEFTLIDQLDHAEGGNENDLTINLGNIIEATDADGDSVVGEADGLVITVDDDTPTASGAHVTGLVDEDGVVEGAPDGGQGDGIPGGVGDVPGEATVANGSVVTMFNSGADAPLSYGFAANAVAVLEALGLTSGGLALDYAIVGDTVTASTAAGDVFTFELNSNGSWEFTLIDQLDHPTDANENDLQIQLGAIIQATDADGDSVVGNADGLVITVDDDTPAQVGEPVTIFVDEDAVTGGNPGGPNDGPGTAAAGSIFLTSQFVSGADEPFTYGMSADTSGLPALTSNGVAIQYQVVGNLLTASAGGNPVFTVALNPVTGEVTFTLIDQIDHATLNGQGGDNTENNLQIDLSSLFTATDADGDSISLGAGSVIVDVDDDTPIALEAQVTGLVDEDGVVEGAADGGVGDGIAGGVGDVAGQDTVASGSVVTLFSGGADQPLSYGFTANAVVLLEGLGLTSNGEALDYAIVGNTVTASTSAGDVFTFQLQGNGNWTFTLIDQLDHAPGANENDLQIQLGSIIQATDADGDSTAAFAGGLVITVDDDTPTASGAQVTGLVDEDGVLEGASDGGPGDGIAGGVGDVPGTDTVATGSVVTMFNTGADAPLSFGFAANAVATLQGLGLTSNHIALSYVVNGNTVTASTAAGDVFTFQLQANGNWTFTLIDQLDHAPGNNENDLAINLGGIVQATDADGDSVVGNANGLVITVDDDTPTASNDVDVIVGGNGPATGNVITGVDIGGGDANNQDGVADHTGADAPVSITAIASVNVPGNVDTDPSANFIIAGAHGTLTLNANGNYSYLRTDNVGGVQDVFTYTLTDADGDSVTATLTISIEDNFPQAGSVNVQLDDETLAGGIAGGTGDVNPDLVNVSGNLPGSGGDAPLTWSLLTTGAPAGFSYTGGGTTVQVFQGAVNVATITITNAATGAYTVTQIAPIDHPDGLNENNVQFTVNYRVTDNDGDAADGTINVDIDDDTPTVSANLAAQLDDDALAGGNAGGTGDVNPDTANLSGTLGHAYGADGPGSTVFLTTGAPAGFTYELSGSNLLIKQGTTTVVTVTLNTTTGAYVITQNAPIAHAAGGAENDVAFTLNYRVTDSDNDSIDGTLVINVDDDTPTVSANAAAQLDDDALAGGNPGGTGDVNPDTANLTGTLGHSYGADGAGSTVFLTTGAPAGFTYELSGSNLLIKQGTTTVVTVTLNTTTGAYVITQNAPIVHAAGGDENDVSFTLNYRVSDSDNDTVDGTLVINVDDDTPVAAIQVTAQNVSVDESVGIQADSNDTTNAGVIALFSGVSNAGVDTDLPQYATNASAVVTSTGSSVGADAPGSTVFSLNVSGAGVDSGLNTTSGQDILLYKEGNLVVGRVSGGADDGKAAFAIAINPTTGVISMVEYLSIQHPNALNADDSVSINNGAVLAVVTVTDADSDSVSQSVAIGSHIQFQDSGPVMTAASNINIQNSGDVAHTGTFAFNLGADGANIATNDVITNLTGSATVGGAPVTNWNLTPGVENATTASYSFSFDYSIGGGATAHETGTLVFDKVAGTYTVDLADPIQGVTTILQTAQGTLFQGYEFGSSTLDGSQPEISVTQIQDLAGTVNDIYVQFTSVAEPSSGTGDNALEVTNWVPGADNPDPINGGGDTAWNAGQLFNQTDSWVSTSNSANGVAGDTIQGGEVLDFNLVRGTNPTGVLANPANYAQASAMFLKFDGIGSGEDMIVVLKLYDPNTNSYTTRAIMVENGDIQKGPGAGPGQYSGVTLDNNDGLVIIEANDYNLPGENWVIVGAQIAGSDEGVTGTAIDLNSAIGAAGDSITGGAFDTDPLGFQSDTNDGPFKISSIGFLTTQTTPQNAHLDFNVTVTDGDGDSITQALAVDVTTAADSSTPIALSAAVTTVVPAVLDLNGDGVHFVGSDAGVTYDYGHGQVATAWAGADDGILVRDANGNGTVDSASEFVFGSGGQTDLQALAAQYGSTLDANDADYAKFGVWQDANSNGVVDAGEYSSLLARGITSINLVGDGNAYSAAGGDVTVAGSSTYTNADGSTGTVADAAFATGGRAVADEQRAVANSNVNMTGIVASIVAAAGLQSAAAAASISIDHGVDLNLQSVQHAISLPAYNLQAVNDDALNGQGFGAEQRVQAIDINALQSSGHNFSNFDSLHSQIDVQSHSDAAPAFEPAYAGNQAPAFDASMLVASVAPAVSMPSAEALIAAGVVGHGQQGGAVEKIVAEALGHAAPTVDALLEAVNSGGQQANHPEIQAALQGLPGGGAGGAMSEVLNGTSGHAGNVSSWDMSSHGAFGATADMMFKMDVASFHHDAVQPVVNG